MSFFNFNSKIKNELAEDLNFWEELDEKTAATYSGGLAGTWLLKTIEGKSILKETDSWQPQITASFEKGQVTGSTGCNQYVGSYEAEGNLGGELTTKGFISTLIGCPKPIMIQEFKYLKALGQATSYRIKGNLLTIFYGSGKPKTLVYGRLNLS